MRKYIGVLMFVVIGAMFFVVYPVFVLGMTWVEMVLGNFMIVIVAVWIYGAAYFITR